MSITTTIPGGCYRSPDGSWHNANGEPIDPPAEIAAAQAASEDVAPPAPAESGESDDTPVVVAPAAVEATDSARELAEANDLDLASVTGTLKDGKVGVDDVRAAIAARDEGSDDDE